MDTPTASLTNKHWNAKSNTELDQNKTELLQQADMSTSPSQYLLPETSENTYSLVTN